MTEHELQQEIRLALGRRGIVLRLNVGKLRTEDGRYLTTGLPPGTCDLLFIGGGHAVFIEVKNARGARVRRAAAVHRRRGAPRRAACARRRGEKRGGRNPTHTISGGVTWHFH